MYTKNGKPTHVHKLNRLAIRIWDIDQNFKINSKKTTSLLLWFPIPSLTSQLFCFLLGRKIGGWWRSSRGYIFVSTVMKITSAGWKVTSALMLFYSNSSFKTPGSDAHTCSKTSILSKLPYIMVEKKNRLSEEFGGRSWEFVAAIGIKITIYYRNGRFFFTKYGHQNIVL